MSKQLKDKAIDIKGKQYVMVKDRISYFNDTYKNGSIITRVLESEGDRIVMKAKVTPDVSTPERYFTGISASDPNKTIEKQNPHEVAETSAVGRALAMMGIGVIDSVASADEMRKAGVQEDPEPEIIKHCKKCDAVMTYKTGITGGKKWAGYFCPENEDHPVFWVNQ